MHALGRPSSVGSGRDTEDNAEHVIIMFQPHLTFRSLNPELGLKIFFYPTFFYDCLPHLRPILASTRPSIFME